MSRYSKYFLQHVLWLDDGYCRYYVQDRLWSHQDIADVETVVYNHERDAEQMLWACVERNASFTIGQLRSFLAEDCLGHYLVYKMEDHEVIQAAAGELTQWAYKVVIEPGFGWAVQVEPMTQKPVIPICVAPVPDIDAAQIDIQADLDDLVAEQQNKYDQCEAMLAKMSPAERAAAYGKRAGKGLFTDPIEDLVGFAKKAPAFYLTMLKKEWRVITFPARVTIAATRSALSLCMEPLQQEITQAIRPFTQTREQALAIGSTLYILATDEQTNAMLMDFVRRYWDATHALEKTHMGAALCSDTTMTILFALISGGVGAAANIITKSHRLTRVADRLQKLASALKKVGARSKLPKEEIPGTSAAASTGKASRKNAKADMPEPEPPKTTSTDTNAPAAKKRKPPASLDEAVGRLKQARKRLEIEGYKPKYTDDQLKAMAAKGTLNDRFVVRFFEDTFANDRNGHLGLKTDGKVRYWSTTFDQLENADTDPKRISQCLGLKYDPSKNYKLAVIDTTDAAKYSDSYTIIPTHEKLGAFAISELKDIPADNIPKVLNDDYAKVYAKAYETAKNKGVDIKDSIEIDAFSNNYFSDQDASDLFKARVEIQTRLGANEYFTGNGITAYTGKECSNTYGVVESFTYDKNPQTIGIMLADGRMKMLDTSVVK
ncbi:MAG: hypothetical protein VR64_00825 [Desulfatitalea sp. BRH_c12]|nr:MAG: hypothetical protein VR64_00825 [Desulfatitalea sp. BRH_c12]